MSLFSIPEDGVRLELCNEGPRANDVLPVLASFHLRHVRSLPLSAEMQMTFALSHLD